MRLCKTPDRLKTAVLPIYKKNNQKYFENYQPVSQLYIDSKLFKK